MQTYLANPIWWMLLCDTVYILYYYILSGPTHFPFRNKYIYNKSKQTAAENCSTFPISPAGNDTMCVCACVYSIVYHSWGKIRDGVVHFEAAVHMRTQPTRICIDVTISWTHFYCTCTMYIVLYMYKRINNQHSTTTYKRTHLCAMDMNILWLAADNPMMQSLFQHFCSSACVPYLTIYIFNICCYCCCCFSDLGHTFFLAHLFVRTFMSHIKYMYSKLHIHCVMHWQRERS